MSSPENGCDPRALGSVGSAEGPGMSCMLEGVCTTEDGATVVGIVVEATPVRGLTSASAETLIGDGTPNRGREISLDELRTSF